MPTVLFFNKLGARSTGYAPKKLGSRPDTQPSHALSRYVNGSEGIGLGDRLGHPGQQGFLRDVGLADRHQRNQPAVGRGREILRLGRMQRAPAVRAGAEHQRPGQRQVQPLRQLEPQFQPVQHGVDVVDISETNDTFQIRSSNWRNKRFRTCR